MHQILTLIGTSVIQIEQNWHQNIQHITALQHVEEELLKHRDEEAQGLNCNAVSGSTELKKYF